jgi:hypothetical protein
MVEYWNTGIIKVAEPSRLRINGGTPLPLCVLVTALLLSTPAWSVPSVQGLTNRWVVAFEAPRLVETVNGIVADLSGCDQDGTPGEPQLPVRGWTIPVPDGFEPRDIRIIPEKTVSLQLARPVAFAQEAITLSADPWTIKRTTRDEAVYKRNTRFPAFEKAEGKRQHLDYRHGKQELTLTLHPIQVIPSENKLLAHGELSIDVTWQPVTQDDAKRRKDKIRNLSSRTRSLGGATGEISTPLAMTDPVALSSPLASLTVDHLIIAPSALTNAPSPWNLSALISARSMMNLSSKVVTTEWIYANYAGSDNADRIRNFICDAYETWSARYVLLVGTAQLLPTRNLYCSFSGNIGSIPSDSIYYGCLDGDFDYDGDKIYGEIGDGIGGGDVDLVAEVQVGRFPVANTSELSRMIRKTLTYEVQAASALTRTATVGEYLGFGGLADYATGAMEQIRFGATDAGFTSLGFENPAYASFFDSNTTLYDTPELSWLWTDMLSLLNQNIHVFNHLGHGAPRYCFKMNADLTAVKQAISSLSNSLPYFVYSQACDVGRFDDYLDCFAEQLVTATNGPVATLMNTRFGWGYANTFDGPSQRFQRKFWDGIFSSKAHQFSLANMRSKEQLRYLINPRAGDVFRWCYYEISLFGDPATPFAARALQHPPTFGHEGLGNQYPETAVYRVAAEIGPAGIYVTDSPRLLWRTSLAPGIVHTNALTREISSIYAVQIPSQPLGTTIFYSLRATTVAGVEGQWPASGEQAFSVTPALSLEVRGVPESWGVVSPAYGLYSFASGVVVRATAPTRILESNGVSRALLGYNVTGSVTSAPSAEVTFTLEKASTLTWNWQTEHALVHTSNIARTLNTSVWFTTNTVTNSLVASETTVLPGKTYSFAGWYLDGQRQPAAPGAAVNPIPSINMAVPHVAYAHYIDMALDNGTNGIPDWWEYRFFGTNNWSAAADDDHDGFTMLQEYADRTDPLNPASYPQAPFIVHTPLASAQGMPPPYLIETTITDSNRVETALLIWRRNEEPWKTNTLLNVAGSKYQATIPLPGSPRDQFMYQIVARDPAGYVSTNGPYIVGLYYPQLVLAPTSGCLTVFQSVAGESEDFLTLTNSGNVTLRWTLLPGALESVDAVTTDWATNALGQSWCVTDLRSSSAPYSFYSSLVSEGEFTSPPVRACLLSPLFHPASGARLTFKYFINTELDTLKPGNAYDGGIVEVSTNNGVTFQQLDGPYTHHLTGWTYSPWTNNTSCFAGDGSAGWQEASFELGAFAGQAIRIRFHAGGDNNTDHEGWYVDDVRVGPVTSPDWPDWLVCAATSGMIAPNRGITVPIYTLATASSNRQECLPLHLLSNDLFSPNVSVDWAFKIRDAPWVEAVVASQTSTNGEGVVTLNVDVADSDREPLSLQIAYSSDRGATWSDPSLVYAQSQYGSCILRPTPSCVDQVATRWIDAAVTNRVSLFWSTQPQLPRLPLLVTNMLMRVCAVSPYFSAPEAITPAFMVDNESPTAPTALASTSHAIGIWSGVSQMSMQWTASSDGVGIGGITYRRRATATTNNILAALERIPGATAQLRPPDGSNIWFEVQAVDLFGNASAITRAGPYCVDTIPPSASNAFIRVRRSAFGPYSVGVNLTAEWGGFTDTLSGIAGYYLFPQSDNNFAEPLFSVSTQGVFAVAALNVTNQIPLFAIDRVGNVSAVVSDSVWVFDPVLDMDGDSFSAADEEIAGTDATKASSRFLFGLAGVQTSTNGVTLQVWWDSLIGRQYTLLATPSLTALNWQPVAGMTSLPGTGTVVTNTVIFKDPVFLRLSVTAP